jgi:hypothetical protein
MSDKLIPSNPADVMVIRHVTPNVVTFSVPFTRLNKIRFGGRGTLGMSQLPRALSHQSHHCSSQLNSPCLLIS